MLTVTDTAERQVNISDGITTLQSYNSAGTIETITVNYAPFSGAPTPVFSEPSRVGKRWSFQPDYGKISSIVLPNGLTYTFQYDSYGEITKITYPSGGYTRYTYEALERPYEWPGNFGGTADQREVTGKYVCRAAVNPPVRLAIGLYRCNHSEHVYRRRRLYQLCACNDAMAP